jgi:hypothetical protein
MVKKMKDVVIGEKFSSAGREYIKTQEYKVSCCKTINCEVIGDSNNKSYFSSEMDVEVNG